MARLKTLRSGLQTLAPRVQSLPPTSARRMTGRPLQKRRFEAWLAAEARCAKCGRTVEYPHGFELDHVVPLFMGGDDTEQNTQVLCIAPDGSGCHQGKTREDMTGGA